MHRVRQDEKARQELMLDLDEIARRGARRMLAEALEAEIDACIEAARETSATREDMPWFSETAMAGSERSSVEPGLWTSKLPGSTTGEWTMPASRRGSIA